LTDIEEIFSTPESEARLDLIRHLIENSELVPLVRGMSGIGKSLLASRLQASAPKNWVVCYFSADSMMQPERMLAHIARCNGLPDAKEDNIRRLVDRFEMLRKRGAVPVLLIDDAQELPPTSLITLLRLYERQVDAAPLVSLVLFADEQIDMLLSTPQLQIMSPQSIQVIDLPSLTREEADDFMRYLLRVEGLDQELALDPSRMSRIYRESRGAPGPLASAILEAVGESGGSGQVTSQLSSKLIWSTLPIGVLVLLILLFQAQINRLFSPDSPPSDEAVVVTKAQSQPELPDVPVSAESLNSLPTVEIEPVAQLDKETPEPIESGSVDSSSQVESPTSLEDKKAISDSAVSRQEGVTGQTPPTPPAREAAASPPPKSVDASAEKKVEKEALVVETPAPAVEPEIPAELSVEKTTKKATTSALAPVLVKSPQWVKERPPGSYTVQLLAVENIESLQAVISKYNLQSKAFSVKTERQDHDWYPLLWGEYPNRAVATEAIKGLPPKLQKGGAWVRSFASLRQ
jgi:DamX protein